MHIYDNISRDYSQNYKYFRQSCTENQNKHFVQQLFPENRTVYYITWKYMAQPEGPKMTTQYGACALHAGLPRQQTHTQNM